MKINNIEIIQYRTFDPFYRLIKNNLEYYNPNRHEYYDRCKNVYKCIVRLNNNDIILILYWYSFNNYVFSYNDTKLEFKLNNIQLKKKMIKIIKFAKTICYMVTFVEPYKKIIAKIKKNKYINKNEASKLIIKSNIDTYIFSQLMIKTNNIM